MEEERYKERMKKEISDKVAGLSKESVGMLSVDITIFQ